MCGEYYICLIDGIWVLLPPNWPVVIPNKREFLMKARSTVQVKVCFLLGNVKNFE